MRIIAGRFKGKRLAAIKGDSVRPTSDRVKESIFSILGDRVVNADFLDLCAGTGNMGLEALSRGANAATFIDEDHRCIRTIQSNLRQCGLDPRHPEVQLIKLDVHKGLASLAKRKACFDLIYFDPPYDSSLHRPCLVQIAMNELVARSGEILVERRRPPKGDCRAPRTVDGLTLKRVEQYGDTMVSFYQVEAH